MITEFGTNCSFSLHWWFFEIINRIFLVYIEGGAFSFLKSTDKTISSVSGGYIRGQNLSAIHRAFQKNEKLTPMGIFYL